VEEEWRKLEGVVKVALRETEKEKGENVRKRIGWWDEECRVKKKEVRRELRRRRREAEREKEYKRRKREYKELRKEEKGGE